MDGADRRTVRDERAGNAMRIAPLPTAPPAPLHTQRSHGASKPMLFDEGATPPLLGGYEGEVRSLAALCGEADRAASLSPTEMGSCGRKRSVSFNEDDAWEKSEWREQYGFQELRAGQGASVTSMASATQSSRTRSAKSLALCNVRVASSHSVTDATRSKDSPRPPTGSKPGATPRHSSPQQKAHQSCPRKFAALNRLALAYPTAVLRQTAPVEAIGDPAAARMPPRKPPSPLANALARNGRWRSGPQLHVPKQHL